MRHSKQLCAQRYSSPHCLLQANEQLPKRPHAGKNLNQYINKMDCCVISKAVKKMM